MKKYAVTCSCGYTVTKDANSREEAVQQLTTMMNQNEQQGVKAHYADPEWGSKHAGQPMPTPEQVAMMMEQGVHEATAMG